MNISPAERAVMAERSTRSDLERRALPRAIDFEVDVQAEMERLERQMGRQTGPVQSPPAQEQQQEQQQQQHTPDIDFDADVRAEMQRLEAEMKAQLSGVSASNTSSLPTISERQEPQQLRNGDVLVGHGNGAADVDLSLLDSMYGTGSSSRSPGGEGGMVFGPDKAEALLQKRARQEAYRTQLDNPPAPTVAQTTRQQYPPRNANEQVNCYTHQF